MTPTRTTPTIATSRTILLATANRESGDPWDAQFSLDHGIRSEPDNGGYITVTPTFLSLRRSWDVVRPPNNRIRLFVDDVARDVFLPVGSGYTVLSMRSQLARLMPEIDMSYERCTDVSFELVRYHDGSICRYGSQDDDFERVHERESANEPEECEH
jgi:hypothetical protein